VSCGVGCRRGSDPALLWLWRRPVATAPIQPLAWEPPYAVEAAQEIATTTTTNNNNKRQKDKKKKNKIQPFRHTQVRPEALAVHLWMKSKMSQPYAKSELRHGLLEHSSMNAKKVTVIYSRGKLKRFIGHVEAGFLPTFCYLTS